MHPFNIVHVLQLHIQLLCHLMDRLKPPSPANTATVLTGNANGVTHQL